MTTAHVCSWGIATAHQNLSGAMSGSGIVYDFSKSKEPIQAPEHNEIGQVIAQTQYDERATCSCTLQVAHGAGAPSRGTVIQIDSEHYYVTNATLTESNQAYSRYSVTLERYYRTTTGFIKTATGAF